MTSYNFLSRIFKKTPPHPVPQLETLERPQQKFTPNKEDAYLWLQQMNIDTIIDIGAHTGESASKFMSMFPIASIYSFEPLRDCFQKLKELSRTSDRFFAYNKAIGSQLGTIQMNRSSFSPSSSILEMNTPHKDAFPFTRDSTAEEVELSTLDFEAKNFPKSANTLVKIDTQGYELEVLRGASNYLHYVNILIIELSFARLYCDQPLFEDVYEYLTNRGFQYKGSWDQLLDPRNGQPLQQDAIFMRRRQ